MAALLISGSYLASRLLGLLRDRLLATHFGIGPLADAYTAAFRLPELLFTLLVSGAFAVAFIPVLTELIVKKEDEKAWELTSSILNILALGTIIICGLAWVFADPLTTIITPGFDAFRHDLTVDLTRIMLVTPLVFAVSTVLGGIQQSFGRFLLFAFSSVFYNLGIIFGIVFLSTNHSIYGVAYGVVLGTLLQMAIQLVGVAGLGFRYRPIITFKNRSVGQVLKLMLPRSLDQGIDQVHYAVETVIGSNLATGSLTAYYYANNLKNVPLALFGGAIATAAFPRMAARAAEGKQEKLVEDFVVNARLILFLVIPAATAAVLLRGYIVRLLFGFGNATTASILGWFAGVIVFQSLFFLISRMFYSLQDTKTPLLTSIFAIGLNVYLSIILAGRFGVAGLAMAASSVAIFESLWLLVILKKRLGNVGVSSIVAGVLRMLLANAIMASIIYLLVSQTLPLFAADKGFWVIAPKFAVICLAGIAAYLVPCYMLGLHEARMVWDKFKARTRLPLHLNFK